MSRAGRSSACASPAPLLKKPRVLIFDDSVSAVDTATEAKIRKALGALEGVTKIIIAQRVTSVMATDKIVVLEDGRIHAVGTHQRCWPATPSTRRSITRR